MAQIKRLSKAAVVAGLFLSKFDRDGWTSLGFESANQAFNVIGLALATKPNSIKLLRDEFDPFFDNGRQGWHKRAMVKSRKPIYEEYKDIHIGDAIKLLKTIIYQNNDLEILLDKVETDRKNTFAKRLLTGQAAENYFVREYKNIAEFQNYKLEDTTKLGCGFDFKLHNAAGFLGIEVKGLSDATGNIALTNKEYLVARELQSRYYLFVVRDFNHDPFHNYFCNPINSKLRFNQTEHIVRQISWTASIK